MKSAALESNVETAIDAINYLLQVASLVNRDYPINQDHISKSLNSLAYSLDQLLAQIHQRCNSRLPDLYEVTIPQECLNPELAAPALSIGDDSSIWSCTNSIAPLYVASPDLGDIKNLITPNHTSAFSIELSGYGSSKESPEQELHRVRDLLEQERKRSDDLKSELDRLRAASNKDDLYKTIKDNLALQEELKEAEKRLEKAYREFADSNDEKQKKSRSTKKTKNATSDVKAEIVESKSYDSMWANELAQLIAGYVSADHKGFNPSSDDALKVVNDFRRRSEYSNSDVAQMIQLYAVCFSELPDLEASKTLAGAIGAIAKRGKKIENSGIEELLNNLYGLSFVAKLIVSQPQSAIVEDIKSILPDNLDAPLAKLHEIMEELKNCLNLKLL